MRGASAGGIIPWCRRPPAGEWEKGVPDASHGLRLRPALEAADEEQLFEQAREHVDQAHPEMEISDEQIRNLITERAYNPKLFRE